MIYIGKIRSLIILFIGILTVACACNAREKRGNNIGEKIVYDTKNSKIPEIKNDSYGTDAAHEKTAKPGVQLEDRNVGGLDEKRIEEIVKEYASKINTPPTNAKLNATTWLVESEGKPGKKVNVEETVEKVLNAREGEKIALVVQELQPEITSKHLIDNITLISYFSTPILDWNESRLNNIRLAIEKIDYKKINPGEEFSFNAVVGRRSEDNGYEMAPVIIKTENGEYEKGFDYGGGVCQLSSTLYNAVEQCGLRITERHIHTKDIGYIPRGSDATVSYGEADFKFVNNRKHPLMLRAFMQGGQIRVEIFENTLQ